VRKSTDMIRSKTCRRFFLLALIVSVIGPMSLQAADRTWDGGAANSNWFDAVNWDGNIVCPEAGDNVYIGSTGGGVVVTGMTAWLNDFSITNNTLIMSNLDARILATNVYIRNAATVTHMTNTDTDAAGGWTPDSRVYIVCTNLTIDAGGKINADVRGFKTESGPGKGTAGSGGWYGGGGYGGWGGMGNYIAGSRGTNYGSVTAPDMPGSGGGRFSAPPGGVGGGWVQIEAGDQVVVNGSITANGGPGGAGSGNGAGSGGGIYIVCHTLTGSNGTISADGGVQGYSGPGGGGGGGRIAIAYDPTAQSNLTVKPALMLISANNVNAEGSAQPGTIWMPDNQLLAPTKMQGGQIVIPAFEAWQVANFSLWGGQLIFTNTFQLTVTNNFSIGNRGVVDFTNGLAVGGLLNVTGGVVSVSNFLTYADMSVNGGTLDIAVTNATFNFPGDLAVRGGGSFRIRRLWDVSAPNVTIASNLAVNNGIFMYYGQLNNGATLTVGKNIVMTNAGLVQIFSGTTNTTTSFTGLLVNVVGDINLASNSWIYPYSHPTNGGSPVFKAQNVSMFKTNTGFRAYSTGFRGTLVAPGSGFGPGAGTITGGGWAGGGGHGGKGADGSTGVGGKTNDSMEAPVIAGSAGGRPNDYGGGVVRLEVADLLDLNGAIFANGTNWPAGDSGGGGGGGGGTIHIRCKRLAGSGAWLEAKGGTARTGSFGGGGGGGRIAIYRVPVEQTAATNTWTLDVQGGVAYSNGGPGTIYWGEIAALIPPTISNMIPTQVTTATATLNGYLVSTGTAPTTIWVMWGTADGGTNIATSTWANTNKFDGTWPNGPVSTNNVGPLAADQTYYYRFYAFNDGGDRWADPVQIFDTGQYGIIATDTNASEQGLDPAAFSIFRPTWATNGGVRVYYTTSGTASNDVDYNLLVSNVWIAAGQTNATITVTPEADGETTEGTETVILTLTGDAYVIGPQNSDTAYIADAPVDPTNRTIAAGYWTNAAIWSSGHKPVVGQHVIVSNNITLPEATANLASFTLTNATLTVTNWLSKVAASNIWITRSGAIALPAPFSWGATSNRVWLVGSNITIDAGGTINADGKGYYNTDGPGRGYWSTPGGYGGGGGYGGAGMYGFAAVDAGGTNYGAADMPLLPGSGGAGYDGGRPDGGHGGGAILLEATRHLVVNGTIRANGADGTGGNGGAAGSGGGIVLNCADIAGSGYVGAGGGGNSTYGGAGGGRVAVVYDTTAQSNLNLTAMPAIRFNADRGAATLRPGRPGTLWFPDSSFFPPTNIPGGQVVIPNFTLWAPDNITASNGLALLSGVTVQVTNDVILLNNGLLEFTNCPFTVGRTLQANSGGQGLFGLPVTIQSNLVLNGGAVTFSGIANTTTVLQVNGNLFVTNSGALYVNGSVTNNVAVSNSVLVNVAGDITVLANSWICPGSHPTNGGSVRFECWNLLIEGGTNGGFNANERGFTGIYGKGYGPGGGTCYGGGWAGGGGHGGKGGDGNTGYGGPTNDSYTTPMLPGSGGGRDDNLAGGLIWIRTMNRMTLNGLLTANGKSYNDGTGGAGGAGGGIYLICGEKLYGTNATIRANGGRSEYSTVGGGGGGGRIAIWRAWAWQKANTNLWTLAVDGGYGSQSNGAVGTIYWGEMPGPAVGAVFSIW
jgi:hypothetical protein